MCRHLAYLGPPVPLARLLFDPPHSLVRQSWAPSDMRRGGRINADGFGVGWYPDAGAEPVVYRRDCPIWSDRNLAGLAGAVRAGAVLAAIRSATVGMPVVETASAPFTAGGWLFSHNGVIAGWPGSVAGLAAALPVPDLLVLEAPIDSVLLWALLRHRLRGGDAVAATAATVSDVASAAPGSRLNLLLTDSRTVIATTLGHSLWARHRPDLDVLVSSEPLDDDAAWREVPDGSLVVATVAGLAVTALEERISR
jgi:glutamine amidotransferase